MFIYLLNLLIKIVLAALLPALSPLLAGCPFEVLRDVDDPPSPSLLTYLFAWLFPLFAARLLRPPTDPLFA